MDKEQVIHRIASEVAITCRPDIIAYTQLQSATASMSKALQEKERYCKDIKKANRENIKSLAKFHNKK